MTAPTTAWGLHTDEKADGLMRSVVEHPFDTTVRLILADRLDEVREAERAEFIRLQCEHSADAKPCNNDVAERLINLRYQYPEWFAPLDEIRWTREMFAVSGVGPVGWLGGGFVEEVRCPMAWWLGGECERCDNGPRSTFRGCPACQGTGRTPGHGAEVVSRHPVTRVVVSDVVPWQHSTGQAFCWWRASAWQGRGDRGNDIGNLPDEVFDRMAKNNPESRLNYDGPPDNQHLAFPTREAADTALSRALVDLARSRAGLPAIPWEVSQ